jgi:hypothetical protein
MVRVTKGYYDQLSSTISSVLRLTWDRDIREAEAQRFEKPEVMDIMGATIQPTSDRPTPIPTPTSGKDYAWLASALALEERQ